MISPFKALQLIYSAKLVEVIVQYQIRGRDVPYKIIVAAVCVWVTVLFPLFLCVYLYVVFLKVTSVKDAEEWLEERVKLHTLYMCTSEYE